MSENNVDKNKDNLDKVEDINLSDLYEEILKIKKDVKFINKNSKKSIIAVQSLKEEINQNKQESFKLKKELEENKDSEIKIYKKIINILDQIDNIYKFAEQLNNEDFLNNLDLIKKIITKEINEINLIQINSLGEFFNPDIHKCIGIEKTNIMEYNQIISVVENGYILKGKIIRPASVIIVK